MPSKKLKVSIRTPKEVFGSEVYIVFVDVTNLTSKLIEGVSVTHQFLPGILHLQEAPIESEMTEHQRKKQRLVREMERQVAVAYRRNVMHGQSLIRRLVKTSFQTYESMGRIRSFIPTPVGVLSRSAADNLTDYAEETLAIIPSYAKEALRIEDWDDVERLERDVISHEDQSSDIRLLYLSNKEKLQKLLNKIAKKEDEKENISLKEVYSIQPSETMAFPFEVHAPYLSRAKTYSLQFKISYKDILPDTTSAFSENEELSFYPSPSAIYAGAFLGAIAGFVVKSILSTPIQLVVSNPLLFGSNLLGSVVLALVFTAFTIRTPDKKKVITTEDFVGGLILGALVGIASKSIFDYLLKFVPVG
jgi:hypothetical protein